jgi:serine/threonine protein kinase
MKDGIEWTNELIEAALREEGRFENLTLLGRGSFGCVCHARKLETGEDAAIKFVPRSEVRGSVVHAQQILSAVRPDLLLAA